MELSKRQEQLLEFVKEQHGDQTRKYTGEPYWTHVYSVAERVSAFLPEATEIALCHDLLEDTACEADDLTAFLRAHDYEQAEVSLIVNGVQELTDVFVKADFPDLNRRKRKAKEAERLSQISPLAQSVKYADLIDNSISITTESTSFAKTYLLEKVQILDGMRQGNIHLLIEACSVLKKGLDTLKLSSKIALPDSLNINTSQTQQNFLLEK